MLLIRMAREAYLELPDAVSWQVKEGETVCTDCSGNVVARAEQHSVLGFARDKPLRASLARSGYVANRESYERTRERFLVMESLHHEVLTEARESRDARIRLRLADKLCDDNVWVTLTPSGHVHLDLHESGRSS
jgi:hypothetical protein